MWGSVVLCRRQKGSVREKKNCTRHSLLLKVFVSFADQHSLYCEEYVHMYTYLYTVKNMCTCTHTSILWRICAHVHISLYCEECVHMCTYLYIVKNMCTCTHTSILWRIGPHVHIPLYCEECVHMYTYLYCEEYVYMYTYLYIVKNMFTRTHISILWRICARVHISLYCEEYVHMYTYLSVYRQHNKYLCFQMTLQVKHFYTNRSGAKCSLAVIIWVPGWRWLGEYLTLDRTFYSLRLKQEVVAATGTAIFASLSHSSRPV
jgi:hypothetical protein